MLREMVERISFLRVITPRTARDRRNTQGSVSFVMRDGQLVEDTGMCKGARYMCGGIGGVLGRDGVTSVNVCVCVERGVGVKKGVVVQRELCLHLPAAILM